MKLPFSFKFEFHPKQMIQSKKVIFAFYLLSLVPFLLCIFFVKEKNASYQELSEQIARMRLRMERTLEIQKDRNTFYKQYADADRYYLDHVLEVATFLKPEVEALTLVYGHPAFETCDNVKKRLDFLTKGDNRLFFSEENRRSKNHIEELDLKQKHPIEINTQDLRNLLSLIEGVPVGEFDPPGMAPQFIMRRLLLRKKKLAERETFLLEMHLIKREVLK